MRSENLVVPSARERLGQLLEQLRTQDEAELRLIIKADVQGSVEVLRETLKTLGTEKVAINVLHGSIGAITTNDVMLASASNIA